MFSLILTAALSVTYSVDVSKAGLLQTKPVNELVRLPKVIVVTTFDQDSAQAFQDQFQEALDSGEPVVPIVIDSYGGSIHALMTMIDVIQASPVPVATICQGKCMSAGALLLAAGTDGFRYASPHSTVLVHDLSSQIEGSMSDLEHDTKELKKLNNQLMSYLSTQCHRKSDFFDEKLTDNEHKDLYFTAGEAKELGIVNHVKTPTIKIVVTTQMVFK